MHGADHQDEPGDVGGNQHQHPGLGQVDGYAAPQHEGAQQAVIQAPYIVACHVPDATAQTPDEVGIDTRHQVNGDQLAAEQYPETVCQGDKTQ